MLKQMDAAEKDNPGEHSFSVFNLHKDVADLFYWLERKLLLQL